MLKKLLTTVLILLGIVLGAAAICVGVMIIFPDVNIFGYYYFQDKSVYNDTLAIPATQLKNLSIETKDYHVEISQDDTLGNNVKVEFYSKYIGLIKADEDGKLVRNALCNKQVTTDSVTLTTTEPTGIVIPSETVVKVIIGQGVNLNDLNISLNGGNFTIDENASVNANNFTYERVATLGKTELGNLKVNKSLNVNNTAGQLDFSNIVASTADVNIKTRIGTFTFGDINNLKVESEVTPYITAGNILGEVQYFAKSGKLTANDVTGAIGVRSNSATLVFGTVKNQIDILNYDTEYKSTEKSSNTSIEIENLGEVGAYGQDVEINLLNGYIKVKNVNRKANFITHNGDITLGSKSTSTNVNADISIKTNNGRVNAYFNKTNAHQFTIEANEGSINAYNVNLSADSTIKGNGLITVHYSENMSNNLKINGLYKDIKVYVPQQLFNFDLLTLNGKNISISEVQAKSFELNKNNYEKVCTDSEGFLTSKVEGNFFGCTHTEAESAGTITVTSSGNVLLAVELG